MQLYEKYRPRTLDDFIGQEKAKKQLNFFMSRPDWDRDAIWIEGPSGVGKTSLAWIIAHHVVKTKWAVLKFNGNYCDKKWFKSIYYSIGLSALKGRWKVYIVNECHAMSKQAVLGWLTLLESLPKHRLIIFTTTESLENNPFGDFSEPFARCCKVFKLISDKQLTHTFARRVKEIAKAESLDSKPLRKYIKLVQDCNNNLRTVLQRVEWGEMLSQKTRMNTIEERERLACEKKLVETRCPGFKMYSRRGIHFFSGWVTSKLTRYKLRLVLAQEHPYVAPKLFLVSPKVLYTFDGRSINSLNISHCFHTESNGPGGCIQISYPMIWKPCCTCVKAIIGGIVWINGYEWYLRTGKSIDKVLSELTKY